MDRMKRFESAMDRLGTALSSGFLKVLLLLFAFLFPLLASNFVDHPLTWPIYAMVAVFFATFLLQACWGVSREPPEGCSLNRLLLMAFFFGADILSTAISSMALMVTFLSFGAFAFVYLVKGKEGGSEEEGQRHQASPWWMDALLLALQGAEILAVALAGGILRVALSFSFVLIAAALLGLLLLFARKRTAAFSRARLISYSFCVLIMVIPAILSCFSTKMPAGFRYFLFPAFGIPLSLSFLFLDLIRSYGLIERFRVPFRLEKKDPCGWAWRLLVRAIGSLFLVFGSAGTIVFYQMSLPEPYFIAFLYVFAGLFFLPSWPLALLYPGIRKGNPLRPTMLALLFALFAMSYLFVAFLYALAVEEGWEPMRDLATPFVFAVFFLEFLALVWLVDFIDLKVRVESGGSKSPGIAIFLGFFALYCNFVYFENSYLGGNQALRIAMASLCGLGYALGQAVLAWNERLFLLRGGFVVLYLASLVVPFLIPDPLLGFLLSAASLSVHSATMDALLPSNPLAVVSIGYRPAF